MSTTSIQEQVEELAEALVFADPTDLQALAGLHTQFEQLGQWGTANEQPEVARVAKEAGELIESIILEETPDPAASFNALSDAVSPVQAVVCEGRNASEVAFPVRLAPLVSSGAASGDASESPSAKGAETFSLPANVEPDVFAEFLSRQAGALEEWEVLMLDLERTQNGEGLDALRRLVHTLKGESGLLGLMDVERLCHCIEDALQSTSPAALVDGLLAAKDWLGQSLDAYAGKGPAPGPVSEPLEKLNGSPLGPQPVEGPPEKPAPCPEPPETQAPKVLEGDLDLLGDFVQEANEHLEAADVHLLTLETDSHNDDALNAVFRAFHTIKGVAGFLALDAILDVAHEAENLLDRARKGELSLAGEAIDVTFDATDTLKMLVEHVGAALASGEVLATEDSVPGVIARIKAVAAGQTPLEPAATAANGPPVALPGQKLGEILVESGAAPQEVVDAALSTQNEPPPPKKLGQILVESAMASSASVAEALEAQRRRPDAGKVGEIMVEMGTVTQEQVAVATNKQQQPTTPKLGEVLVKSDAVPAKEVVRALRSQKAGESAVQVRDVVKVDAKRLDLLVDAIGEMVIAESMVSQSLEGLRAGSPALVQRLDQLDKITRELQEMGLSLRMVPIRPTFQKMARLARDLAKKSGKEVEFVMEGEDTELDKSVVDKIGDPLIHMVRNAMDHGIEASAEQREALGKPRVGRVELRAFHKGGSIHIEIRDDGQGLAREAIVAKAVERGVVAEDASLTDREVWNLIFEAGFSTAKKVTDVSGRGVGMDVVRRNIESLRGQVDIQSEKNKGSVFSIRLPLTLAIIDGMVVGVGQERYIIPTLSITMSLRPEAKDLSTVVGRGELLMLQGKLIPILRLGRLFGTGESHGDLTGSIITVVEADGRRTGLVVDEILGQQQTVIKSLGESMRGISGIAGGAIMADGRVGLILDVSGLIKLAAEVGVEDGESAVKEAPGTRQTGKAPALS